MIASTKCQLPCLKLLLILSNALNRSVQTNGQTVKKIQNASQPFRIARKNVELKLHAGVSAFQQREVKLPLTLLNALKQMHALALFLKLFH